MVGLVKLVSIFLMFSKLVVVMIVRLNMVIVFSGYGERIRLIIVVVKIVMRCQVCGFIDFGIGLN